MSVEKEVWRSVWTSQMGAERKQRLHGVSTTEVGKKLGRLNWRRMRHEDLQ